MIGSDLDFIAVGSDTGRNSHDSGVVYQDVEARRRSPDFSGRILD
jgi:hypothetical protein